jgi:hypothetical protein
VDKEIQKKKIIIEIFIELSKVLKLLTKYKKIDCNTCKVKFEKGGFISMNKDEIIIKNDERVLNKEEYKKMINLLRTNGSIHDKR